MPYYPPVQAKIMLKNYVVGPIGARVPCKEDYFNSFLYHIIFHKGFFSGVRSTQFDNVSNKAPENNYGLFASNLASNVSTDMSLTLEDMERVLKKNGWVPKLDTLSAIARLNEWVRWNYFTSREIVEVGLSVLILKKIAHKEDWIESIESDFGDQDFKIIKQKVFSKEDVIHLSKVLRGGNWHSSEGFLSDYLPYNAYILLDLKHKKPEIVKPGRKEARIRMLKTFLRKKYSNSLDSFIHATDDTDQSWEYIDDIFPNEKNDIQDSLSNYIINTPVKNNFKQMIKIKMHTIKERAKAKMLERFE
jgi:hypothetical protein